MKKIKNRKSVILATMLTSLFLSVSSVQAADDDKKCKVTYQNEKGEAEAWFVLEKPECDQINAAVKKGDLSQLTSELKDKVREKLDLPEDVMKTLDNDMSKKESN